MGTFTVNRSMQRVQKDTLAQVDKGCILRIFPDKLEGSKTSLILKDTKTEASCRTIFMTAALREELKQWLERLKREEALDPERYRNSGMLLRLPNGLAAVSYTHLLQRNQWCTFSRPAAATFLL